MTIGMGYCKSCGFEHCQCIDLIVKQTMKENQNKIAEKFFGIDPADPKGDESVIVSVDAEGTIKRLEEQRN